MSEQGLRAHLTLDCSNPSVHVSTLLEMLAAATERADRLEAAGNAMAEAIRHGIRDGLRDCGEGCEHPACRLMRAEKRWRALVGAREG